MAGNQQVQMRAELARRDLITYGDSKDLKARLANDEARGIFEGNLATMSEQYLQDGCKLLCIPSTGGRQKLINNIRKYNAYKRQKITNERRRGK